MVKLFSFVDDMTLYTGEPKDSTKRLLELTRVCQTAICKINIPKLIAFVYTDNAMAQKELLRSVYMYNSYKNVNTFE